MGRYVTGDFEYKFAFGDQSSSFGEVLESLIEGTDNSVRRYISEYGEIVRLQLIDSKGLINNIKEFIKDLKPLTQEQEELWSRCKLTMGDDYWNKTMMKLFLEVMDLEHREEYEQLEFDVEY